MTIPPNELPPNERPNPEPGDGSSAVQTLIWAVTGGIVLLAILAGVIVGFLGGRLFQAGQSISDERLMQLLGAMPRDGALTQVDPYGPAGLAGLATGDILISIDGVRLNNDAQTRRIIGGHVTGDTVIIVVERAFRAREHEVVLGVWSGPTPILSPTLPATATPLPTPTASSSNQRELAKLGVYYRTITEEDGDRFGTETGAILLTITTNGPAYLTGLEPGDIVLSVGVTDLGPGINLEQALSDYSAGQTVRLRVLRDGSEDIVEVTLGG